MLDDADCFSPLPTNSTFVDKSKHGSFDRHRLLIRVYHLQNILQRRPAALMDHHVKGGTVQPSHI